MSRRRVAPPSWLGLLAAVVLGLVGCAPPAPTPTDLPAAPATPVASMAPPQQVCTGVDIPPGVEQRVLTSSDGSSINTAWLGSGRTVAVLLHQTDGNGLCGMLFYADYLAKRGIRAVAVDLCGYSQSFCQLPFQDDPVRQVELVSDAVRAEGAGRVVLVGASMGGSLAVAAAGRVDADAVVDLSGPAQFNNLDVADDAASITMPIMVAFGKATDPADLAAVRAQLPAMPTTAKRVVVLPQGHGVELLRGADGTGFSPLARQVLDLVR